MLGKDESKRKEKGMDTESTSQKSFYSKVANVFKATRSQNEDLRNQRTSTYIDDNDVGRDDPAQSNGEPRSPVSLSRNHSTSTASSSHNESTTSEALAERSDDQPRNNAHPASMVITLINTGRNENDRVFVAGGPLIDRGRGSVSPSTAKGDDLIKSASSSSETLVNPPHDQPSDTPYRAATVMSMANPRRTVNVVVPGRPNIPGTPAGSGIPPRQAPPRQAPSNQGQNRVFTSSTYNVKYSTSTTYTSAVHNQTVITGTTSGRNVQVGNITNSRSRRGNDSGSSAGTTYNTYTHDGSYPTGTTSGRNVQQGMFVNSTSGRGGLQGRQGRQSLFMGTRISGGNVQQGIFVDRQNSDSDDSDED